MREGELAPAEGLTAITGETGAGKTILAHSLDLIMGGKARPQIVRPGAPRRGRHHTGQAFDQARAPVHRDAPIR